MTRPPYYRLLAWTAAFFLLLCAWDAGGLDLPMARWFGNTNGFALRDDWFVSDVLHSDARRVAWALQFGLILAIWWPVGVLRRLTRYERVGIVLGTLACLIVVSLLKDANHTSCPWELVEFGGKASYVSHWSWGIRDGGTGHCFPAGHASAAFCLISGYFWLRDKAPRAAWWWLAVTLVGGSIIAVAQQMRGAHYTSHTLWTAWICWAVSGSVYAVMRAWATRRSRGTGEIMAK